MSTRKLIITALVVGMVILIAGAVQFIQIANTRDASTSSVTTSAPTTAAAPR